jgi:hypothetical protein
MPKPRTVRDPDLRPARNLEQRLEAYGMRPRSVVLAMLAACWLENYGNDIADNFLTERNSLIQRLQRTFGGYEIAKRVMLIAASGLKRGLYRCSTDQELATAIEATRMALGQLEQIATRFDFKVKLFTVHPYQELDGAFETTEKFVRGVVPRSFEYVPTARHFRKEHYYPYDGHFNALGHAHMAAVMETSLVRR